MAFVFAPTDSVINSNIICFGYESFSAFSVLQSRTHECWARLMGSTVEDRLLYAVTDCFDTFPFPHDFSTHAGLERVGADFYTFRARLLERDGSSLTALYNEFHDPNSECEGIQQLRDLQEIMDRTVLNLYGWTDIQPAYRFNSEFEDDDQENEDGRLHRKKYRYRWLDGVRDEVLARLLELNRERALAEGQVISHAQAALPIGEEKKTVKKKPKRNDSVDQIAIELGET